MPQEKRSLWEQLKANYKGGQDVGLLPKPATKPEPKQQPTVPPKYPVQKPVPPPTAEKVTRKKPPRKR